MVVGVLDKCAGEVSNFFLARLQERLPNGIRKHTNLCTVLGEMTPDLESYAENLKVDLTRPTAQVTAAKVATPGTADLVCQTSSGATVQAPGSTPVAVTEAVERGGQACEVLQRAVVQALGVAQRITDKVPVFVQDAE